MAINFEMITGESPAILSQKVMAAITGGKQPTGSPFSLPGPHGPVFYQEVAESTGNAITAYELVLGESVSLLASKLDAAETGGKVVYGNVFTIPGPHGVLYYQAAIEGTVAEGGGGTGPAGPAGPPGPTGATGATGPAGPSSNSWLYDFSTSTSGDPGSGKVALNNATPSAATSLLINHVDKAGTDINNFIHGAQIGQQFRLQDQSNSTNWSDWTVSGVVAESAGWDTIPIVFRSANGSGSTGFANNHDIIIITQQDAALKGTVNVWTKNNRVVFTPITDAATVTVDASQSNNFYIELTEATTLLNNPTNLGDGMVLNFLFKQGTGGNKLMTFGSKFKFLGGTNTLSVVAGNYDLLSAVYHASNDVLVCNLAIGAS